MPQRAPAWLRHCLFWFIGICDKSKYVSIAVLEIYIMFSLRCDRWLPILMTASLWRHHQTNWCVRSAFMYLPPHTKWHAVGESTANPVWMNTRNAPTLAQTAGKEDRTSLTPEVRELQYKARQTRSVLPSSETCHFNCHCCFTNPLLMAVASWICWVYSDEQWIMTTRPHANRVRGWCETIKLI